MTINLDVIQTEMRKLECWFEVNWERVSRILKNHLGGTKFMSILYDTGYDAWLLEFKKEGDYNQLTLVRDELESLINQVDNDAT